MSTTRKECVFKHNWFLMFFQVLKTLFPFFINIAIYGAHIQSSFVHIHKIQFLCTVLNNLLLQISGQQMLGQKCVRLLDAALKDYFLQNLFYQKQFNFAMSTGVVQTRCSLS